MQTPSTEDVLVLREEMTYTGCQKLTVLSVRSSLKYSPHRRRTWIYLAIPRLVRWECDVFTVPRIWLLRREEGDMYIIPVRWWLCSRLFQTCKEGERQLEISPNHFDETNHLSTIITASPDTSAFAPKSPNKFAARSSP
jgi:hypothetical protein